MSITREHLKLAALAAGHTIYGWCTGPIPLIGEHEREMWRPHLDDGDAARLAAAVGMKIIMPKHAGDGAFAEPLDGRSPSVTVYRKDRAEQMRHAIVLCAAAVGDTIEGRVMSSIGEWVPELDGRHARPWVVARKNSSRSLTGYTEMLMNAAGDVRRFGSRESAQKLCDGLNGANNMRGFFLGRLQGVSSAP